SRSRLLLEHDLFFRDVPRGDIPSADAGELAETTHQAGMLENCGTSSGFSHFSRRLVNISSIGATNSGRSRLPSVTKIVPGKLARLLVNTRAPQSGQKLRSSPLPDSAI